MNAVFLIVYLLWIDKNFESLLIASGYKESDLDRKVVQRTKSRYANKVLLALSTNDKDLAREAYEWTQSIPQTNTSRALVDKKIEVDGCLIGSNEHLEICFVDRKPSVLKTVTLSEFKRVQALLEASVSHENLVSVILEQSNGKYFVIMPLLPITVEHMCGMSEATANLLWDQISSALDCLHLKGFVHKDVKSANICVDVNGNFILIDFGDTVQVGYKSASTAEYVPSDIDSTDGATALIDWWMLSMTIYDRMQPSGEGLRAMVAGQQMSATDLLTWFEIRGFSTLLSKILSKVHASV